MEDQLSHRPDELLARRGDSLGTNVASSSSSLSATAAAASKGPDLLSDECRAPSETNSETNNNLKIFKNEYHPVALNTKSSNGILEQPQATGDRSSTSNGAGLQAGQVSAEEDWHRQQPLESSVVTLLNTVAPEWSATTAGKTSEAFGPETPDETTTTYTDNTSQRDSQEQPQVPSKPPPPPPNNRSILILREIEPHNPESSIRDIFDSENCPSKPVHCEYALQNSWYVTFRDDEDARLALAYLRNHIVKWNGRQIMARYKPKPAVASAANQPPPPHHHHHHHHNPCPPHHHNNQHSHHQKQHIAPPMVMQQQEESPVENGPEGVTTLSGVLSASDPAILTASMVDDGSGLVVGPLSGQPPDVLSPATMLNTSGGSTPNDGQLNNHHMPGAFINPSYGHHTDPYQTAPLPPHHHQPDGSLALHPQHLNEQAAHMMGSAPAPVQPVPHHQDHQNQPQHHSMPAGYNPYYSQQSQMVHAPWDLSTVFVYNGLSPYNKTSVSSVQLVGGAYSHQHQHNQHQQLQPHHAHQQHHHHQNHKGHNGSQRHQNHHHYNHNIHHHRNQKPPTPTSATAQQQATHYHQGYHNHNHQQSSTNNNVAANGQPQQAMFTPAAYHQGSKPSRKNNKQHNK